MEEKNISENEEQDKKSWLEEQLQKRKNISQSEDTFTFKEDTHTVQPTENTVASSETKTNSVQTDLHNTPQNEQNFTHKEEIKHIETPKIEENLSVQTEKGVKMSADYSQWRKKLSQTAQKKLWGKITVKNAVLYGFGGIVFIFLLFNLRYILFNESKVPTLHNVNVKDTLLTDFSPTKVLDPNNPDENGKKSTKKQDKPSNNHQKNDNDKKQGKETNETGRLYYRVKAGDKFNDIASKHGLTPAELKELNPKVRPERIQPGQKLKVKKID